MKHALVCSALRVGLVNSLPMSCHSAVNNCAGAMFLLAMGNDHVEEIELSIISVSETFN